MIRVLPFRELNDIEELYKKENIELTDSSMAVIALDGKEKLGYALFSIKEGVLMLFSLSPLDDIMLCDGILRSALHVGVENGVTEAYFINNELKRILNTLDFILDEEKNEINIQKLFGSCSECKV